MRIKGILWDLDGVLADTGVFHFKAWSQTLKDHNIAFNRTLFDETFGMNNHSILVFLLGKEPPKEFVESVSNQKEKLFRGVIQGKVKPLPGVIETLSSLQKKGLLQAIASSAPIENIDALIDELQIRHFFQAVISGNKIPGKPAPDIFFKSADAIGVSPENCLVIEDAVTGVEGAKRAGMICLAVTTTHPAQKLAQADFVVNNLAQLGKNFWNQFDQ